MLTYDVVLSWSSLVHNIGSIQIPSPPYTENEVPKKGTRDMHSEMTGFSPATWKTAFLNLLGIWESQQLIRSLCCMDWYLFSLYTNTDWLAFCSIHKRFNPIFQSPYSTSLQHVDVKTNLRTKYLKISQKWWFQDFFTVLTWVGENPATFFNEDSILCHVLKSPVIRQVKKRLC